MIAETNQAYGDSGINHRVNLVARSEVDYAQTGREFNHLATPDDGHMDEVHPMRDRTGADLVHLIFKYENHPYSGFAVSETPFGPADAVAVLNTTGPAVALWRERPRAANRPPTAREPLGDQTLRLGGTLNVDVSGAFTDPDGDPLTYVASSSAPEIMTARATGARLTLTAATAGEALITVTATDPGELSATQSFRGRVTTHAAFTDDPLVPGATPIKAVHFMELRTRIDARRRRAGLAPFRWTDPALRPRATPVKLTHLLELREALAAAYAAEGRAAPMWTDAAGPTRSTPIRAAHLTELRAAVMAQE